MRVTSTGHSQNGPAYLFRRMLLPAGAGWLFLLAVVASHPLKAQNRIVVAGIVVDSARLPLPYVAIQIKGEPGGSSTGEDATFYISCMAGDTLVFTRLGYHPFVYAAAKSAENVTIIMNEMSQLLNNVTIYDKLTIPGVNEWKKDANLNNNIIFRNPNQNPTQNTIPTFGPGIVIGFGGKDKNRRDESERTRVYRETINSAEVKKKLMDLYGIPEETFNRKLEAFNKKVPDAAYLTNRDEIIAMLIQFFAMKEP